MYSEARERCSASARGKHRMHQCPAARVTGTGCNWTPITYVRAVGRNGEEKEKEERDKSEQTRGEAKCRSTKVDSDWPTDGNLSNYLLININKKLSCFHENTLHEVDREIS